MNIHPLNYKEKSKSAKDSSKSESSSKFSFSAGSLLCGSSKRNKAMKKVNKENYPMKKNTKSSMFALDDHSSYYCGNPHKSRMISDPFHSPNTSLISSHQWPVSPTKSSLCVITEEENTIGRYVETPTKVCDLTLMQNVPAANSSKPQLTENFRPVKPARSPFSKLLSNPQMSPKSQDLSQRKTNVLGELKGNQLKNTPLKINTDFMKTMKTSNAKETLSTDKESVENNPELKVQGRRLTLVSSNTSRANKIFNYAEFSLTQSRKPQKYMEMFDKFERNSFATPPKPKLMPIDRHDLNESKISIEELLMRDKAKNASLGTLKTINENVDINKTFAHGSKTKSQNSVFNISLGLPRKSEYVSKPGTIKKTKQYSDVKLKIESDRKEFFKVNTETNENYKNLTTENTFKNRFSSIGIPRSSELMSKPGTIKPNMTNNHKLKTTMNVEGNNISKMGRDLFQIQRQKHACEWNKKKEAKKEIKINKDNITGRGDCKEISVINNHSDCMTPQKNRCENTKTEDTFTPSSPELENFSISFDDTSFLQHYIREAKKEKKRSNSSSESNDSKELSSPADSLYLKSYKEQLVVRANLKKKDEKVKPLNSIQKETDFDLIDNDNSTTREEKKLLIYLQFYLNKLS